MIISGIVPQVENIKIIGVRGYREPYVGTAAFGCPSAKLDDLSACLKPPSPET